MAHHELDGHIFTQIVAMGAQFLSQKVKQVDALNVFPVPDGDTGTNMNLTLTTGIEEMKRNESRRVGQVAGALSRGLLMGARGNSGVILSQLFRGFAKAINENEIITSREFALALQQGVDTAYKAVIKPVEGTVLTVAREAARHARKTASTATDITLLMEETVQAAKKTLAETPEMLPVLKQTGVVDAGGQGLVYIYEGMLAALKGETAPEIDDPSVPIDALTELAHQQSAQSHLATEDIKHGFCTEFILQLTPIQPENDAFDEAAFRDTLSQQGDSLLVVADDDLVKVHIHTENPLELIAYGAKYGEIRTAKIENMREQHRAIVEADVTHNELQSDEQLPNERKRYGIVAVAMGAGIADIFRSLGVDEVIEGGQTMNPSTEDIIKALQKIRAEHYIILPNNSNVVMAAQQAGQVMDQPVTVVPSKTVPQGFAAMLAFNQDAAPAENETAMSEMVGQVQTGQVTYAVRDSQIDGFNIKEGDYLGIADGKILASQTTLTETAKELLTEMVTDDTEIVTVFFGQETNAEQVRQIERFISDKFSDVEVEVHNGGQPLYYFLFAVE